MDRNARRVVENHGFDGDWCLESLVTMGACLLSREDRASMKCSRRKERCWRIKWCWVYRQAGEDRNWSDGDQWVHETAGASELSKRL